MTDERKNVVDTTPVINEESLNSNFTFRGNSKFEDERVTKRLLEEGQRKTYYTIMLVGLCCLFVALL